MAWVSVIGRLDITHAVASLSRFSTAPREEHLNYALQIFGYLKKYPNKRLPMDSSYWIWVPPLELAPGEVRYGSVVQTG